MDNKRNDEQKPGQQPPLYSQEQKDREKSSVGTTKSPSEHPGQQRDR